MMPEELDDVLEEIERLHESPIELQFGYALAFALVGSNIRLRVQYVIAPYRYDFALLHPTLDKVLLLIECDGKEFHSSTQQRANDRAKELVAADIGAFVVRYSGAAIFRNAKDCAQNTLESLMRGWAWVK